MKRVFLTAAMFALFLAQSVCAQKPNINWFAKNSEADTFHISTADELAGLLTLTNNTAGVGQAFDFKGKTIVLDNDIDLSKYGANYNGKKGWVPIGGFNGIFDGNGKKITGLYINNKVYDCAGLFVHGTVKNLGVVNVNIIGNSGIGGIVGCNGTVVNSYSTGKVTGIKNIGGIAGQGINIVDSYSSVVVNGQESIGGLAGSIFQGNVTNSYSTGTVSGKDNAGGVTGIIYKSNISNSYSTGTINGNNNIGGVVGKIIDGGEIVNSYSIGAIKGNNFVGGIVGSDDDIGHNTTKVSSSYSTGTISGKDYVGGVAGKIINGGEMLDSYSTGSISGSDYVGGIIGYTNSLVTNSYSTGIIKGNNNVGGVAGNALNIANSYSISIISGNNSVGGIAGSGKILKSCVALNPSVKAKGKDFGRIVGTMENNSELLRNVAFNGMMNNAGNTLWLNKGTEGINGADFNNISINADGTLGGRLTNQAGFTVEDGKLPGLNTAVDMPKFLLADSIAVEQERAKLVRLTDTRDGKKYRGAKIGTQTWLAENLNYEVTGSKCYENKPENCQKYGRLYNWATAMKICPTGWHLPSNAEWDVLYSFVDGTKNIDESPYSSSTAGKLLKAIIFNGTDEYGFAAFSGGIGYSDGDFSKDKGNTEGYWWSTSIYKDNCLYEAGCAHSRYISYYGNGASDSSNDKSDFLNVRCIKD